MLNQLTLMIILAPLIAGLIAGIYGKKIGRQGAHGITILGVAISFVLSLIILRQIFWENNTGSNTNIYTWGISGNFHFYIGFLIDRLSAVMMSIVTFISLAVHIYSIGYMKD